jgi:hypothetical protein
VNGATAKQPTYIGQGYAMTRLKATDVEDSLTMVLGHGYYYGGKPSASLHHIKPAVISQPRQRQPAQILVTVLPPRAQGDDSGISVRGDGEDIVVRPRPTEQWEYVTKQILHNIIKSKPGHGKKGALKGLTMVGSKSMLIDRIKHFYPNVSLEQHMEELERVENRSSPNPENPGSGEKRSPLSLSAMASNAGNLLSSGVQSLVRSFSPEKRTSSSFGSEDGMEYTTRQTPGVSPVSSVFSAVSERVIRFVQSISRRVLSPSKENRDYIVAQNEDLAPSFTTTADKRKGEEEEEEEGRTPKKSNKKRKKTKEIKGSRQIGQSDMLII